MANRKLPRRGQVPRRGPPKSKKGPLHAVPCGHCNKPNDFRDVAPDLPGGSIGGISAGQGSLLEEGMTFTCDHCGRVSKVDGVTQATVVAVKPVRG